MELQEQDGNKMLQANSVSQGCLPGGVRTGMIMENEKVTQKGGEHS